MDSVSFLSAVIDSRNLQIDWIAALKIACILALIIFGAGAILRSIFGRGSSLTRSVSATLNILLIYLTSIVLYYYFPTLRAWFSTLPFITLTSDHLFIWGLSGLPDLIFYPAILQMAVLAFFVNMLETYLPRGRNLISWYLYRVITGLCAFALYTGFSYLVHSFAPEIFGTWSKPIILGFWGIILLVAVLKLLLSAILTVLNPILGACYAFFFHSLFGKQFSKAILTTVFMVLIVYYLNQTGYTQLVFSDLSMATYGPVSIIMLIALYLFGSIL